ncbi:alpha/beta hydrolase [Seonamhaeicola marinus]|uniref:Alpha/beta hydrolase n=1 Tax=Seonamhaeicola marinus TaxID=1912246 RepID=A0A5D0HSM8_9FLAO|nr:alpha/beta hydrolase [Seonamhaeicola marinus]TYA74288.1 alpha/beta hydrolase [Seonamhaeicola marinus]
MFFSRKYNFLALALFIGLYTYSQTIKKASANASLLQSVFKMHPEYDKNKDGVLTESEYRNHQHNRDYRKHKQPFKGYYNYVERQFYANNKNEAQSLDIIIPINRKSNKLPALVFIHGGGWKKGDKSIGLGVLDPFISTGEYIGVTINYRLSKEAKWPAQIHDCKAAIRWLRGNAEKFGIDKNKIGVWGFSAGGHLTTMMAVSSNHKEFEGTIGNFLNQSSTVTCAISGAGPTDFLMKKSVSIIPELVDNKYKSQAYNVFNLLDDGSAIKEKAKGASPIYLIDENLRPILLYHGTEDPLVNMEHSESFVKTCKEKGASNYYLTKVEGLKHESKMPSALKKRIQSFFQKYLNDKNITIGTQSVSIDK